MAVNDAMAFMINDVQCCDTDSIDFLIASPKFFPCTEVVKVQPMSPDAPAPDAFTRFLRRLGPALETLQLGGLPPGPSQLRRLGPGRVHFGHAPRSGDGLGPC